MTHTAPDEGPRSTSYVLFERDTARERPDLVSQLGTPNSELTEVDTARRRPHLAASPPTTGMSRRFRSRLFAVLAVALVAWVLFFDSHSVLQRIGYARELDRLTEENAGLEAENERLKGDVEQGLDAATVERVAREQYGMRRPGERVYRVDRAD